MFHLIFELSEFSAKIAHPLIFEPNQRFTVEVTETSWLYHVENSGTRAQKTTVYRILKHAHFDPLSKHVKFHGQSQYRNITDYNILSNDSE